MKVAIIYIIYVSLTLGSKFVSYIGQAGSGWAQPASNEAFLKNIGVPGYGASLTGPTGYNTLNFAFWISTSTNGGAAANGAAYDWQTITSRITSTSLRQSLTGSSSPSADELRQAIKNKYAAADISIFISAFGGNDHPMANGKSATSVATSLAAYCKEYKYDGVDIDWEESGKFTDGTGEAWLTSLTNTLYSQLGNGYKITHAPQAPYFKDNIGGVHYPNGGYVTVHKNCGDKIEWYNIQFYNQGGTTYADYNGLFMNSIGWSTNSAVYEIVAKGIPASKIVVGKHTYGDGSTFMSGSDLKNSFDTALASGLWSAGFMSWQFYKELNPSLGSALITYVRQCNWPGDIPTSSTTARPTTSTTSTTSGSNSGGNIMIENYGSSSTQWFYAGNVLGVSSGYVVSRFEIRLSDYTWHSCDDEGYAWKCQRLPVSISTPLSVRLTAGSSTLTSYNVVTTFTNGQQFDFGKNFGSSGGNNPSSTARPTPRPTPPTPPPSGSGSGSGGGIMIRNRAGSNAWWYMIELDNVPSDVRISSVKMKSANVLSWETAYNNPTYYTFAGTNRPYNGPFSFKITASNGRSVTGDNIISSAEPGLSGTMPSSLAFTVEEGENNVGVSWTVWFAVIVSVFVFVVVIFVAFCVYYKWRKGSQKGKAYFVESELVTNDGNNTNTIVPNDDDDDEEAEIEIDVDVDVETQTITATHD